MRGADDLCRAAAGHAGVVIRGDIRIELDFQTSKPYPMLSILRNLLDNAIEAAVDGQIRIAFTSTIPAAKWEAVV